jgi:hypothetical protein
LALAGLAIRAFYGLIFLQVFRWPDPGKDSLKFQKGTSTAVWIK